VNQKSNDGMLFKRNGSIGAIKTNDCTKEKYAYFPKMNFGKMKIYGPREILPDSDTLIYTLFFVP